jgi:hypothetical protein
MKTLVIAIATAALMSAAATPTLAHCGGSHGKSYRAAQAKKPAVKAAAAVAAKPAEQIASVGPQTILTPGDGGATF